MGQLCHLQPEICLTYYLKEHSRLKPHRELLLRLNSLSEK